jgi:hypothetical protein
VATRRARVKARYVHDNKGFTEFARSDQMLKPLYEAAHDIRRIASQLAPRSDGPGPHYADQFKVDSSPQFVKIGTKSRRIVTVVNEDPAAAPNEFGGKRNEAQHPLGRAGAAIGDYRGAMDND